MSLKKGIYLQDQSAQNSNKGAFSGQDYEVYYYEVYITPWKTLAASENDTSLGGLGATQGMLAMPSTTLFTPLATYYIDWDPLSTVSCTHSAFVRSH